MASHMDLVGQGGAPLINLLKPGRWSHQTCGLHGMHWKSLPKLSRIPLPEVRNLDRTL